MISAMAKKLANAGYPRMAELILKAGSMIVGNEIKIKYQSGNFWTHYKNGWGINEASPDVRFDPDQQISFIRDVYFSSYLPSGNDVFVDVGAGIGMETIYLARQKSYTGKIYAIEASPHTFEILKANIDENHLENVNIFHLAISDQNGSILIDTTQENHISNSVFSEKGTTVNALTMDSFLELNQIETVDLLKVNIEGAEQLLIKSFESIGKVKHVAISCHDFLYKRNGDLHFKTREIVSNFLKDHHFDIHSKSSGVDYVDDWIYGTNKLYKLF
jgi:FkbM family methyltransferase